MNKGFTLIELLVVVLIIGILASVALPQYNKAVMKSRAVDIVTFLENVNRGVDMLLVENGSLVGFALEDLNLDYSSQLNCTTTSNAAMTTSDCTALSGKWTAQLQVMPLANVWMMSVVPTGMEVEQIGIGDMAGTFIRGCVYKKNSSKGKMFCDAVHSFDNRYEVSQGA